MADSLPSFSNAQEMRAYLMKTLGIPSQHPDVASKLREAGLEDSVHYETAVLSKWLRSKSGDLKAGSLTDPRGRRFRHEVNHELARRHVFISDKQFESLCRRFDKITINAGHVREIIDVLHKVPMIRNDEDLRTSWDIERRRLRNKSYRFRDLVSPRGTPTHINASALRYDYLIFRPDAPKHINAAFLRFYGPKDGGVRMMGLRLDSKHQRYGSKGWLTAQPGGSIVTNYLVTRSRRGDAVEFDGGNSTMYIPNNDTGVHSKEGLIEAGPCLHWQALSIMKASVACSYVIRLKGFEKEGGRANMTPEQRHRAILEMQEELSRYVRTGFSSDEAAHLLATQTAMKPKYFNLLWQAGANDVPDLITLPKLDGQRGIETRDRASKPWCITRDILESR